MIDLKSESARQEFRRAIKLSEKVREEFNQRRAVLIQKTLGDNWSTDSKRATITSLLYRAYETFSFDLAINRPRCLVTARNQEHSGFARNFSIAINNYAKQINFADELMAGIMDALFGMAVFKRYWSPSEKMMTVLNIEIEEPGEGASRGEWMEYREQQHIEVDPGQPMIERLCPEDWIYDTAMGRRRHFRFEAHRYRRAVSDIKDDRRFNKEFREAITSSSKFGNTHEERAVKLSQQGFEHDIDELEPMATLWDIWLPRQKTFVTMSDNPSLPPGAIGPWNGPPGGPFTPMIFSSLPDNFEPVSLLGNLEAAHDIINSTMRKMNMQARRQKNVTAYSGPENDAIRYRDSNDGDLLRVMSPEAIQILKSSGVDPSIGQYASIMQQIGSKEAGNLELIAGTAQMSDTAAQDEMLNARSNAMQSKRMQRVAQVAGELYEALGWMLWHDAALEVPGTLDLPKLGGIRVDATWRPDDRMGEIEDYEFSYTPYNEAYMAPAQKAQLINGLITNFYVPLLPVMQQSGQTLDFTEMAQFHEDMLNAAEIRRFIKPMPAPPPDMMGGGGMTGGEEQGALEEAPAMPGDNVYRHEHSTTNPVANRAENAWGDVAAAESGM